MGSYTLSQVNLTHRPTSKHAIAQNLFGSVVREEQIDALQLYFVYYNQELRLLHEGLSEESWQTKNLAAKTYEDIFFVVDVLRDKSHARRPEIRQSLSSRFPSSDHMGLDRSINLALRLWLMLNTQEPEFAGLRHEATLVQWNDESSLLSFIHSLFPCSRWQITAQSSRLGPHFTAAFMQRVCGLSIVWTTSIHDHLRLDRLHKVLYIFPYKCHLQALINSHQNSNGKIEYVRKSLKSAGK